MKNAQDFTLHEISHMIDVAPITFEEVAAYHELLNKLYPVTRMLIRHLENYMPKHVHTCEQCRTPKKEKEPEINFSLD
jgi:hypothetical protein